MNKFRTLLKSTGLLEREASAFLQVNHRTVQRWISGQNTAPEAVLDRLYALMEQQESAAITALEIVEDHPRAAPEIGYCTDDREASHLGWPYKSAHDAVIRRIFEMAEPPLRDKITLVPQNLIK